MTETYCFLSEVETEEDKRGSRSDSITPSRDTRQCLLSRVKSVRDGWKTNEEEGETEEEPRSGKDVYRRLQPEQRVPHRRSSQEDGSQNVELQVVLVCLTGEQGDLETGRTQHLCSDVGTYESMKSEVDTYLSESNDDGIQRPAANLSRQGYLKTRHDDDFTSIVGKRAFILRRCEATARMSERLGIGSCERKY